MFFLPKQYTTPSGNYYRLYKDMLEQPHLLVAGATGSGKSTLLNGLMYTLLYQQPSTGLILCDPKRVDLAPYKNLPHTITHARTIEEITQALTLASSIMEKRFEVMERRSQAETDQPPIYIIFDEVADFMLNATKKDIKLLQHLAEMGRAAHIHLILATQAPNRKVIPANIALNLTGKVALHCECAIESRQIIGQSGAELLPQYGECIYKKPCYIERHKVLMYSPEELQERVNWWKPSNQRRIRKRA